MCPYFKVMYIFLWTTYRQVCNTYIISTRTNIMNVRFGYQTREPGSLLAHGWSADARKLVDFAECPQGRR